MVAMGKSFPLMYYTLFNCIMHFCTCYFLQIRKCNFLRAHTPVGVLSSLSLVAIYFIYFFICIILFCFHIVFLMTITTFELNCIMRLNCQRTELRGAQILKMSMCHNTGQCLFVNRALGHWRARLGIDQIGDIKLFPKFKNRLGFTYGHRHSSIRLPTNTKHL